MPPAIPFPAQRLLRFLWILAIVIVVAGSLLPNSTSPMRALNTLHLSDVLEHFLAYAVLAFLPSLHESPRRIFLAAGGMLLLGLLLEIGQLFVATRSWQLSDLGADAAGVCAGILAGFPLRGTPLMRALLARTVA